MARLEQDSAETPGLGRSVQGSVPRSRVIADEEGRIWTVEQLRPTPTDPIQASSLVFTTESLIRRVRRFPPNWSELPDVELYALSLRR